MSDVEPESEEQRMTFTEHLGELRVRIIRSGIAFIVAFVGCLLLSRWLLDIAAYPLRVADVQWTFLNPLEPIAMMFRLAAYGAIILTSPYIIYQICAFIFPGLRPDERRVVQTVIYSSGTLVVLGLLTAYFGVFPLVLPYLLQWSPDWIETQLRVNETIAIITKGMVGFAIAFQFPVVVLILIYLGLLTPEALKQYRKLAWVIIALGSAILTPPDPISMSIMMLPMVVLYEGSILVGKLIVRKRENRAT